MKKTLASALAAAVLLCGIILPMGPVAVYADELTAGFDSAIKMELPENSKKAKLLTPEAGDEYVA